MIPRQPQCLMLARQPSQHFETLLLEDWGRQAPPYGAAPMPGVTAAWSSGVYAPLTASQSLLPSGSAGLVLAALAASYNPQNLWWATQFWVSLQPCMDSGSIESVTLGLLQQFGYNGAHCTVTPRMPDFKSAVERLPVPLPATGGTPGSASMGDHGGLSGVSTNRWTAQLPVDFRRSALETFRNMRSCGCVTVRDWMSQSYTGDRRSDVWIDLWTFATTIDFRVADAASHGDEAVITLLN